MRKDYRNPEPAQYAVYCTVPSKWSSPPSEVCRRSLQLAGRAARRFEGSSGEGAVGCDAALGKLRVLQMTKLCRLQESLGHQRYWLWVREFRGCLMSTRKDDGADGMHDDLGRGRLPWNLPALYKVGS